MKWIYPFWFKSCFAETEKGKKTKKQKSLPYFFSQEVETRVHIHSCNHVTQVLALDSLSHIIHVLS